MTDTAESRWESHNEAGRRAFRQGNHAAAEQEFIAAIREANALGEDDPRLAASLAGLAQIKYLQRDFQQAEALFKRALAIRERTLGDKHPDVAATLNGLARLYFQRNDHVAAAPLLMRLLAIKQEALGAHHPEVAVILTSLAKVRLAEHQYEDAEQLARRALLIREEIHKPNDPAVAMSLDTLADVLAARGLLEEEQRLRKRIEQIRGATEPRENPREAGGRAAPREQTRPAPHVPPAPPAPQSPPAPDEPRRTTSSASLPWIEPPASPALRRPAPRPFATPGQIPAPPSNAAAAKPTPAAARPAAPPPAQRNTPRFAAQYTPPASRPPERRNSRPPAEPVTGKVRKAIVQPTPFQRDPHAEASRDSRREAVRATRRDRYESREVAPRRRSPFRMVAVVLFVVGCAGGAWMYFSAARVTSSAGAALDSSALEGGAGEGRPEDSGSPAASSDPSYGLEPPVRQKPPAGAYLDDPPVNAGQLDRSASVSDTPGGHPSGAASSSMDGTASPLEPSALVMPSTNVDRITAAIGENARAKADSLGRKTITIKPPDFKKP